MKRITRRIIKLSITILLAVCAVLLCYLYEKRLENFSIVSGLILFALLIFLMLFNGIRKLPFFSFSNARFWSQTHIYVGLFTLVGFFTHVGLNFPRGLLETVIYLLFVLVAISGLLGLWIYRTFPQRLTRRGEEVIYERIPALRHQIKMEADDIITDSVNAGVSQSLIDFYLERLQPFLSHSKNKIAHLFERNHFRYQLQLEMQGLSRFLDEKEKGSLDRLSELVNQKDDLDYHHALQLALKFWLFVHIPLAYGLLIFVGAHVFTAWAFTGV